MGRACNKNGKGRSAFRILTAKPIEKISLGMTWHRSEDNIRMDLKYKAISMGNWFDSAQDRDY